MNLTSVSVVTLTIISLMVVPSLSVPLDNSATSSERQAWTSSAQQNFDALQGSIPNFNQDYDFQSFSPDFSAILNDISRQMRTLSQDALDLVNNVIDFFNDPFNLSEVVEPFNYLVKANRILTNITDARSWYDSLTLGNQLLYEFEIYPDIFFLSRWIFYSPSELNA